jgi:hypothetical protein
MSAILSSYWLVGIEALPVEVRVDGDRVSVVDPETDQILRSVRLEATLSGDSVAALLVNARTRPGRNLAPADLKEDANGIELSWPITQVRRPH